MIRTSFHIVRFTKVDRFVGMAWNYDHGIMISTGTHTTYTGARNELGDLAGQRGCEVHWFHGEYTCDGSGSMLVHS